VCSSDLSSICALACKNIEPYSSMGSDQSKSLAALDAKEVAQAITQLGQKFEGYGQISIDNGVDGELLAGMTDVEVLETLDDLDITNRLHRRVLIKVLKSAGSVAGPSSRVATFYKQVPTTYNVSISTPKGDLVAFEEIARDALNHSTACFAGVNLVSDSGAIPLAAILADSDGDRRQLDLYCPEGRSMCTAIVKFEMDKKFVSREVWAHLRFPGDQKQWYTGHVVLDECGHRIGMVCMVDIGDKVIVEGERIRLLEQLAADTEYQLKLRRVLLERQRLADQIMKRDQSYDMFSAAAHSEVEDRQADVPQPKS